MLNSFVNNLFGTIAEGAGLFRVSPGISFVPLDDNHSTMAIRGRDATWLGLQNKQMQLWAYMFCSPLSAVIDRLAEADINGKPEILRSTGKGKENYATSEYARRMNNLLKRPNPLQSWEQFRGQQVVYKKVFGFCPVWPIMRAGFSDPSEAYQMWNLPPWLFDVESTKKLFRQRDVNGMVKTWVLNILNERIEIPADKIFILEDSFMQDENSDFLLPKSRLVGLDFSISNICATLEADNVLLKKKGPLGFMSHDAAATKDSVTGYLPMTSTEKAEVQNDLNQYGMSWSQYQYVISRQAMKWNPMSFDVRQLGTKETFVQGTKSICHRYNYSYTLLEDTDTTYANGNQAAVSLYQNNIIPTRDKDDKKYEAFFKMDEENCKICSTYDHLPILQATEKQKAETLKAKTDAYLLQYKNNIITMNMMLEALGQEKRDDGDIYYSETEEAKAAVESAQKIANNVA